jgi:hypothetical protein
MGDNGGFPGRYLITNGSKVFCINTISDIDFHLKRLKDYFIVIIDTEMLLEEVQASLDKTTRTD